MENGSQLGKGEDGKQKEKEEGNEGCAPSPTVSRMIEKAFPAVLSRLLRQDLQVHRGLLR